MRSSDWSSDVCSSDLTRFLPLDKTGANNALTRLRRQWFAKRKSIVTLLREVLYNEPAQLLDSDADNKALDADMALQELGGDHVAFGYQIGRAAGRERVCQYV